MEFSISFGLDRFLCSKVVTIRAVSSLFGSVVLFPEVCIPKKCVIRPLGGGIDGLNVSCVVLCCEIVCSLSVFRIQRSTEPSVFNAQYLGCYGSN